MLKNVLYDNYYIFLTLYPDFMLEVIIIIIMGGTLLDGQSKASPLHFFSLSHFRLCAHMS